MRVLHKEKGHRKQYQHIQLLGKRSIVVTTYSGIMNEQEEKGFQKFLL